MHNQRQIDALHTSMVAPGFSQTVCAEVAAQAHLSTDGGDDFPGLATSDRLHKTIGFGIEKDEMLVIDDDFRILAYRSRACRMVMIALR